MQPEGPVQFDTAGQRSPFFTTVGKEPNLPGRERPKGGSKAGHASLPPFPECLLHQFGFGSGIDSPKRAFARLFLRTRDFNKIAVQGKVVPNGILRGAREREAVIPAGANQQRFGRLPPSRQTAVESSTHLPAFICSSVIRVMLGDMGIDPT